MKKFPLYLLLYCSATLAVLIASLSPLTSYLYLVIKHPDPVYFLTLPIGFPLLWLTGFFLFTVLHSMFVVRILPPIVPGKCPILSDKNKIYSLRLSADNMGKFWVKSLEWIPFLSQLFLYKFLLSAYGVKIGKRVYFSTETRIDAIPLIEIGNDCFFGPRSIVGGHILHHGSDVLYAPVKIGNGCFIGHSSIVTPGAIIGEKAILGAYSVVLLNTTIPPGETWVGLPARKVKEKATNDSAAVSD